MKEKGLLDGAGLVPGNGSTPEGIVVEKVVGSVGVIVAAAREARRKGRQNPSPRGFWRRFVAYEGLELVFVQYHDAGDAVVAAVALLAAAVVRRREAEGGDGAQLLLVVFDGKRIGVDRQFAEELPLQAVLLAEPVFRGKEESRIVSFGLVRISSFGVGRVEFDITLSNSILKKSNTEPNSTRDYQGGLISVPLRFFARVIQISNLFGRRVRPRPLVRHQVVGERYPSRGACCGGVLVVVPKVRIGIGQRRRREGKNRLVVVVRAGCWTARRTP